MAGNPSRDFVMKVLRQMYQILSPQRRSGSTVAHTHRLLFSSHIGACYSCRRSSSSHSATESSVQEKKRLKITPQPPSGGTSDWIGPPDATSNIRPIKFYIPPNETETEKEFRLRREDTLQWNHTFWAEHNARFFSEKELFTKNAKGEDSRKKLTPEEMSVFYRKFLNDNRKSHLEYNKEWYKRNISLLWPAFKVALINLRRKLSRSKSTIRK